jgi:hypothetical protein
MTIKEAIKIMRDNLVDGDVPQEVINQLMADGLGFYEMYEALGRVEETA